MHDPVVHPAHYTGHPSGIETIEIAKHLPFCLGNAFKYLTRYKAKGNPLLDLQKCRFYLQYASRSGPDTDFVPHDEDLDRIEAWVAKEPDPIVAQVAELIINAKPLKAAKLVDQLIGRVITI